MKPGYLAGLIGAIAILGATISLAAKTDAIHDIAEGSNPAIACDGKGQLHVAYEGYKQGERHVFYLSSKDGGQSWEAPYDVSKTSAFPSHPCLDVEKNGAIDLSWIGSASGQKSPDVFFARLDGNSWSKPLNISNTPGASSEPDLAAGPDGSIHLVWKDSGSDKTSPDIYYSCSTDAGKSWSKPEDISNTANASSEPAIALGPDRIVHAVWQDASLGQGRPAIFYAKRTQGSWTARADITGCCASKLERAYISAHPDITCDSKGKIYLIWVDNRKKEHAADIWCRMANKLGQFGKAINISDSPGVSSEPAIAAGPAEKVAIVWCDTSSGVQRPDIFGRIGIEGGFSSVIDITHTSGLSKHPSAAFFGNKLFVVWQEEENNKSVVKMTTQNCDVATGPATEVEPLFHSHSR